MIKGKFSDLNAFQLIHNATFRFLLFSKVLMLDLVRVRWLLTI